MTGILRATCERPSEREKSIIKVFFQTKGGTNISELKILESAYIIFIRVLINVWYDIIFVLFPMNKLLWILTYLLMYCIDG